MTWKVKVGSLTLTESRDVNLPQEHAAWHQTVRVEPGVYDVYAYLDHFEGGTWHIHSISAQCEGVTVSSNYRSHVLGVYSASDNNVNGTRAEAHIRLQTYGCWLPDEQHIDTSLRLDSAISMVDWVSEHTTGVMWRFVWNPLARVVADDGQPYWQATQTAHVVMDVATVCGGLCDPMCKQCHSMADEAAEDRQNSERR